MEDALDIEDRIVLFPEGDNGLPYRTLFRILLPPRMVAPEERGGVDGMLLHRPGKVALQGIDREDGVPEALGHLPGRCLIHAQGPERLVPLLRDLGRAEEKLPEVVPHTNSIYYMNYLSSTNCLFSNNFFPGPIWIGKRDSPIPL